MPLDIDWMLEEDEPKRHPRLSQTACDSLFIRFSVRDDSSYPFGGTGSSFGYVA